ncbi:MAG: metal ABC transporter ATP-binding protein [Trueperaceae bacterium]
MSPAAAGPEELAARTVDASVRYGKVSAVEHVSLEVPVGVMGAIVGPNGAGKSTLLKLLLGLQDDYEGEVYLLGEDVARSRHRVAYVPQRSTVDWDFPADVLDVVLMGLYRELGPLRRVGRVEKARARAALAEVGMADFERRQIGQLSGGQQQRVFLARALVQQAELYLLDEPFAGVDAASELALVRVLKRLNAEGVTVLAVHHDLNTLEKYFDWLALLNVRLMAQGPLAATLTPEALQAAYGGRLPSMAEAPPAEGPNRALLRAEASAGRN